MLWLARAAVAGTAFGVGTARDQREWRRQVRLGVVRRESWLQLLLLQGSCPFFQPPGPIGQGATCREGGWFVLRLPHCDKG